MPARERHYRWEWRLDGEPEALWPLVADTNRFNRDAGVPALEVGAVGANARRRLRLSRLGIGIEWEEDPFEWVRPHRFSVVRRYVRGPVAELRVTAVLTPRAEGGTALAYAVDARPRNLLGRLAVPLQIGLLSRRRFDATFRRYGRLAARGELPLEAPAPAPLAPGGRQRLASARGALVSGGGDLELVDRLAGLVERADDLTLSRLRPYELADYWKAPRRAVLELFLEATRAGLLELRWDVLCPLCRGSARGASSLAGVDSRVHCDTCNIDFGVNFDRSVELSFRPSPAVREVEAVAFCVAGPQVTPHVVTQQLVAQGGERTVAIELEPGRYRVRTLLLRGGRAVLVDRDGVREATVQATESGWPPDELRVATEPTVRLENATGDEQLFILERMAWTDQAVTAAEVTALQLFRDLFSTEALRPGEPISVGALTIVFTDLRESTRFYREVGDAPAFGAVAEHLDLLRGAVAAEGGAVVKTLGDAIMAVFTRPVTAVRSLLAAQRAVAGRPLTLKVGIHAGPCIAVTQNGRLDYFGSTVNLAARLVDLSSGTDVVVSGAVLRDPEVAELRLDAEPLEATVKGFDADSLELWRVSANA